jgi:predicted  nucleic acid-binding Zn-ribbon protein
MILKWVIKLLLKLLFFGRAAYELSSQTYSARSEAIRDRLNQAEHEGEEAFSTAVRRFSKLEEELNGRVETLQKKILGNGNGTCATATEPATGEVNALRAELAELRVELRDLKRRLPPSGRSGHDPDKH